MPPLPPSGATGIECHVEGQGVIAGPPVQARSSLQLTVPLLLGAAATAIFVATVTTAGTPTRKDLRDAQKARANPSGGRQVVVAWMTTRVMSLPGVTKPRAVAAMWLYDGGPKDIAAARAYVNHMAKTSDGVTHPRVLVYDQSESQPLERARRELAASRTNPSITEKSRLAGLQQDVMGELHRTGLWKSGIRSRETHGVLTITGDIAGHGGKIGNAWRDTRIAKIARLHGFYVFDADDGWGLLFEPEGWSS